MKWVTSRGDRTQGHPMNLHRNEKAPPEITSQNLLAKKKKERKKEKLSCYSEMEKAADTQWSASGHA